MNGSYGQKKPQRLLDPVLQEVRHTQIFRNAFGTDHLVDPGLDVPDPPLLVVDHLPTVGGGLHRPLDRLQVLVVLVHHGVEAGQPGCQIWARSGRHLALSPVGGEPRDVKRVRLIASGQNPRIGNPRASSGVITLGKIP